MGVIKVLNFLRIHAFGVAVVIWALFVTYIVFLAKPQVVYIESEPEIIVETVTEYVEVEVEVKVPVEVETTAYYRDIQMTEEEWLMLGQVVHVEAGNQPSVGKRAVIEVIFNRVKSADWPDTVAEVLTQKGQFTKFSHVDEEIAWENTGLIVEVLQEEVTILRGDCVYFATRKNANGSHYIQIGDHYFAY